ncbi:ankyrin repeat-containing domain protein [Xylaria bambusicola]|uniref:ankyrin repeat-containing domain protein n=1 Tax=Xylaria bambusicola TaxID=326684 RepID=UPI0020085A10|nr:ankyrin repeat-containing domain protein [Xylaria bambusicola]KAI0525772.1 ankyrin repeat-containing domain protein [Xylaria bambusicola]
MDISQFASQPSDPTWEEPRYEFLNVIHFPRDDNGDLEDRHRTISDRAKALNNISQEFVRLIGLNAPPSQVECFIKKCEVTSLNSSPAVQPNVFAWLNDTDALRWASENNNEETVRLLLKRGFSVRPWAVLFAAAKLKETKNTTIIELLLNSGWDINKPLGETRPPLLCMVLEVPELVHWCLERGADASLSSPLGLTIIEVAASCASLDTLKLLLERVGSSRQGDAVARASLAHTNDSQPDRVEVVRFLLDQGYPIDECYQTRDPDPDHNCAEMFFGTQNALHFAIWSGKEDMVRLLLERGTDKTRPTRSVMKTDWKTLSPVELARKFGHLNLVPLLEDE